MESYLMLHLLLQDTKLVLASASPRRKELFELLGLTPLVIPANVHEPLSSEPPQNQTMRHARAKAAALANKLDSDTLVVGADTLVALEGEIFGKPASGEEAWRFLRRLSGRTHRVYTGIGLCWNGRCELGYERSLVEFAPLSDEEIKAYIATGEPLDKAGAYGIQGYGAQFIKRIRGCYFNVMGFPIHLFYNMVCAMTDGAASSRRR